MVKESDKSNLEYLVVEVVERIKSQDIERTYIAKVRGDEDVPGLVIMDPCYISSGSFRETVYLISHNKEKVKEGLKNNERECGEVDTINLEDKRVTYRVYISGIDYQKELRVNTNLIRKACAVDKIFKME